MMKEVDIRPRALFDQYLALCRHDAETFFAPDMWEVAPCPACGAAGQLAFEKHGFPYRLCPVCDTLFASPRPTETALHSYYTHAPSVKFWATHFYKETESARRERVFRPRAELVCAKAAEILGSTQLGFVIDIGAGYGVFCEEISKLLDGVSVCAIEPAPDLAQVCRAKGLQVIERFLEKVKPADLPGRGSTAAVFTSFELLEHLHTPRAFLTACRRLMQPQDILIMTTLSGTGLDIQLLWEHAQAVFPPHHLNFLNPFSLRRLAEACDFEVLDVTTPGKLDVDIVANNLAALNDHRFFKTFYKYASEAAKEELQLFLQKSSFSSHMMAIMHSHGQRVS